MTIVRPGEKQFGKAQRLSLAVDSLMKNQAQIAGALQRMAENVSNMLDRVNVILNEVVKLHLKNKKLPVEAKELLEDYAKEQEEWLKANMKNLEQRLADSSMGKTTTTVTPLNEPARPSESSGLIL